LTALAKIPIANKKITISDTKKINVILSGLLAEAAAASVAEATNGNEKARIAGIILYICLCMT
jgi:hypothetical protein